MPSDFRRTWSTSFSVMVSLMECRCYHGGEGRTKMKLLRYKLLDLLVYGVGVVLLAGVITLSVFGL